MSNSTFGRTCKGWPNNIVHGYDANARTTSSNEHKRSGTNLKHALTLYPKRLVIVFTPVSLLDGFIKLLDQFGEVDSVMEDLLLCLVAHCGRRSGGVDEEAGANYKRSLLGQ